MTVSAAIAWVKADLITQNQNEAIIFKEKIADTPWSKVYKIITSKRVLFLKQTPPDLYIEALNLERFNQFDFPFIPKLIAKNASIFSFLIESMGEYSVRSISDTELAMVYLEQGIKAYTQLQRYFECRLFLFDQIKITNYRLNQFPKLYQNLLKQKVSLINDGLTLDEYETLQQLFPKFVFLSKKLQSYQIKETISHCDFHEGNLIIKQSQNTQKDKVNIIDWGEIAVSHPFFSLNSCLWHLDYQRKINKESELYQRLKRQCIKPWLNLYKEVNLSDAFDLSNQLSGFYASLNYQFIYAATQNEKIPASHYKKGALSGCLRTLIDALL